MNKFIITIILSFLVSCSSKSQSKEIRINNLKTAFKKNDDKAFFQNFPKDYDQFVKDFGWNDNLDTSYTLYNESTDYIDRFFAILSKDKTNKSLTSIIDIGIDGKYQADGVNYFKFNIEKLFTKNPSLVCNLLKNRRPDDIDSFWYFYLDSPQPLTSVPDYLQSLKNECGNVFISLEKQLKIIQKENLVSEVVDESKTNKLKILNDFIPKNYLVLDSLSVNINQDNLLDKIIVLSHKEEFKNNESRLFMILFNIGNNNYSLKFKSPNVIPCLKCTGGTGGEESYSDLSFKNNILSFTQLKIIDSNLIKIRYAFLNNNIDFILNEVNTVNSDLTSNNFYKNTIIPKNKIALKNFNYQNYTQYLRQTAKITDPDGYTNLRKEKNTSSEILQKINTGSEVQVLDNSGDWWLVQTKEGKKGYVYKTKIKEE
ncbi:Bacterial SH3 domain protein [Flavobacterium sp. ACN2]|uniref:SH3 domain-containing protein n=1 Tax=unclassified Flavobacterium TaxID=196869 RepID=UPI000BB3C62B|nr:MULTISPECIES: SH3 domain-containing protein [unclassified Flavobacterium]MDY0988687.1 SH3 domain-containing protein [Flavobacterium sp. CFBP9031]PBI88363.1 Bacterial SH3 domain protein [Flavobacterium sp. ACN2]